MPPKDRTLGVDIENTFLHGRIDLMARSVSEHLPLGSRKHESAPEETVDPNFCVIHALPNRQFREFDVAVHTNGFCRY